MGRSISDYRKTNKKNRFRDMERDSTEPRPSKRDAYAKSRRNQQRANLKREWL